MTIILYVPKKLTVVGLFQTNNCQFFLGHTVYLLTEASILKGITRTQANMSMTAMDRKKK